MKIRASEGRWKMASTLSSSGGSPNKNSSIGAGGTTTPEWYV